MSIKAIPADPVTCHPKVQPPITEHVSPVRYLSSDPFRSTILLAIPTPSKGAMKGSQSVHTDLFTTRQTTIQGLSKQVPYVYDHDDRGVHRAMAFSSLWAGGHSLGWPTVQGDTHALRKTSASRGTILAQRRTHHVEALWRSNSLEEHTCRCGTRKSAPILVGERESVLKGMRADDDWWQIMNSRYSRASMGNLWQWPAGMARLALAGDPRRQH
jgi:hypothetical protein